MNSKLFEQCANNWNKNIFLSNHFFYWRTKGQEILNENKQNLEEILCSGHKIVIKNKYCLLMTGFVLYYYFCWLINIFGDKNINIFGEGVLSLLMNNLVQ
jgi:hypothetical protein